jgi:selenocysteine-specific elongation factor
MTVLATAGHVDHGKSTLVNFLTNQETDRLAEEKNRGLTINLGYTYFEYQKRAISIVDVPGHQDYFKNTIAGFSNVNGVLFCIDSVQGWSRQSEEHFKSIVNLGIRDILVIFTKTDLLEEAPKKDSIIKKFSNIKDLNFQIVEFSSKTSNKEVFHKKINDFFKDTETDEEGAIWVDRTFLIEGIGTVVTGTASKALDLSKLHVSDYKRPLEVKKIQSLGKDVDEIFSTSRIAISLKKNPSQPLQRGDVISNNFLDKTEYLILETENESLSFETKDTTRAYIGTSNQIVKQVKCLSVENKNYIVVHLDSPISTVEGQNILLHNLLKNDFLGGEIILKTNNNFQIKKLFKNREILDQSLLLEIFTFTPKKYINKSISHIELENKFLSYENLNLLKNKITDNLQTINDLGVEDYFYKKLFIEKKLIEKILDQIEEFDLVKNQIIHKKEKTIDLRIYKMILNEITPELSINEVDLSKFDKESIKTLFMNNYLYRLNKKLIISDQHKSNLIELLKDLPDIFTVKEFKDIANLSRKYAIPYLEFLDNESITVKVEDSGKRKKLV